MCSSTVHSAERDFGEAGWHIILHALAAAPHIPKEVAGLKSGFVNATDFDPAAVLRDLKCAAAQLVQQQHNRTW